MALLGILLLIIAASMVGILVGWKLRNRMEED